MKEPYYLWRQKNYSFQKFLEKCNRVSIYQWNLQLLATEMFEVQSKMAPKKLNGIF